MSLAAEPAQLQAREPPRARADRGVVVARRYRDMNGQIDRTPHDHAMRDPTGFEWVRSDMDARRERLEQALSRALESEPRQPPLLDEAMRYAVLNGGKRVRPLVVMAACEAAGGDGSAAPAVAMACAVEMIHSWTLVLDDLPMFDDDDLRRGRPSCHVRFGEPVAILAANALFARAFRLLAEPANALPPETATKTTALLAEAVIELAGGQLEDKLAEGQPADAAVVESIHLRKTASLMRASAIMGAFAAEAPLPLIDALGRYGEAVGMAFQISDDILNETGAANELGKPNGSDRARGKSTATRVHGLEAATRQAKVYVHEAQRALDSCFGPAADPLRRLADCVLIRRS